MSPSGPDLWYGPQQQEPVTARNVLAYANVTSMLWIQRMDWVRTMYRIPLRVGSVDLDDDETLVILEKSLSDLEWLEIDGRVNAVIHVKSDDPVGAIVQAARRIAHALPSAVVHEVDQDLVSMSDVAHRLGISRETVRTWVVGKRGPGNFPAPVSSVGGGESRTPTKIWPWSTVVAWLREHYRFEEESAEDDEQVLPPEQIARANAALLGVKEHLDTEWEFVTSYESRLVQDSETPVMRAQPGAPSARTLDGLAAALYLVEPSRSPLHHPQKASLGDGADE